MRGQAWPVEEMMKLFAVVLFGLILILVIMAITGALGPLLEDICIEHPEWPFCGGQTSEIQYTSAKQSTAALTCAINSVAQGQEWMGSFTSGDETIDCDSFYTTTASLEESEENGDYNPKIICEENSIKCDCGVYYAGEIQTKLGVVTGENTEDVYEQCRAMLIDNDRNEIYTWTYGCSDVLECTVTDFQLPEDLGGFNTVEEFITGFGDPSFVVYWQNFPVGEDEDWTGASAWYQSIGRFMLWGICLSHALTPIMKTIGWATRPVKNILTAGGSKASRLTGWITGAAKSGSSIVDDIDDGTILIYESLKGKTLGAQISRQITNTHVNRGIIDYFRTQGDDAITAFMHYTSPARQSGTLVQGSAEWTNLWGSFQSVWGGGSSASNLAQYLDDIPAEGVISTLLQNIQDVDKVTLAVQVAKTTTVRAGVAGLGAYIISRVDSQIGKFIPEAGSIVLKKPLIGKDDYSLENQKIDKPSYTVNPEEQSIVELNKVVVLGKGRFQGDDTPFYLASPCYTDLTIKPNDNFLCGTYSYNSDTDLTVCDNPEEQSWYSDWFSDTVSCGALPLNMPEGVSNVLEKEVEIINDMSIEIYNGMVTLDIQGQDPIQREMMTDPINDIIVYYDPEEERIDYIRAPLGDDEGLLLYSISSLAGDAEYSSWQSSDALFAISGNENRMLSISPYNAQRFIFEGDGENTNLEGIKCKKREASDTEKYAGFYDDEYFVCDIPYILIEQTGTFANLQYYTSVSLFWSVSGNGEKDKFKSIVINKIGPGISHLTLVRYIVLRDDNDDKKIDGLHHYYYQGTDIAQSQYRLFDDIDGDGAFDEINSNNCKIGAIEITLELESNEELENRGIEDNYCYMKKYSTTIGLVGTTVALGTGAITKVLKVGGVKGWLLSTAIDCGIAYLEYRFSDSSWPGG